MAIETAIDHATQVHSMDARYAADLRHITLARGGATVFRFAHEPKRVKNLGWLLRNAHRVSKLYRMGSFMVARLTASPDADWSGHYCCDWADESVMLDWLRRPSFRDVPLFTLERI